MTSFSTSCLARYIVTIDNYPIDTSASVWHIPTPIGLHSFNFDNLGCASQRLKTDIKYFIAGRLGVVSPNCAWIDLLNTRRLLYYAAQNKSSRLVDELAWMDVILLKVCERHARSVIPALGMTLRAWDQSGAGGLSKDLRANLPSLDLQFVPGPSPVLTRCPVRGSLTRSEQKEAVAKLRRAFDGGRIKTANYANAALILVLALRPGQVAVIKVRDVSVAPHLSGASHALEVTRLKQRRSRPGESFTTRRLMPELGRILELQCETAKRWAVARSMEPGSAPLFPRGRREEGGQSKRPELAGFEGHCRGADLAKRFTRTMSGLQLKSSRTGMLQHITPIRARRTLATLHRESGGSVSEVGTLLDHSSVRAPLAYIEPGRGVMARVESALATDLQVIVAAFGPFERGQKGGSGKA